MKANPVILSNATPLSLCLRQPIITAIEVVGTTKKTIQRWKFSCTQKVVEIIGSKARSTGVSKQCTAQITDILIARESNHPWAWHLTDFVVLFIYKENSTITTYLIV